MRGQQSSTIAEGAIIGILEVLSISKRWKTKTFSDSVLTINPLGKPIQLPLDTGHLTLKFLLSASNSERNSLSSLYVKTRTSLYTPFSETSRACRVILRFKRWSKNVVENACLRAVVAHPRSYGSSSSNNNNRGWRSLNIVSL